MKSRVGTSHLLLITLACLAYQTLTRKTFLVKEQYPALLAPRVAAYDTSWKVFNVAGYSFTIDN